MKSREKVAEIVILGVGLVVLGFEFSDLIFELGTCLIRVTDATTMRTHVLDMLFLALPEGTLRRPVLFLSLLQTRVVLENRSARR